MAGLKIGLKAGLKPASKALSKWSWHSDDLEHELRDAEGKLPGRIESNAGRHRLTHPRTTPILSWPDLEQARRRAENFALMALPLDPQTAFRVKRDNRQPNPMRPPVILQLSTRTEDAIQSDWRPTGNGGDIPDIPDFLQRKP